MHVFQACNLSYNKKVAESLETLKGVLDICMGWHIMHRTRVYLYVLGPARILFWYSKGPRRLSV